MTNKLFFSFCILALISCINEYDTDIYEVISNTQDTLDLQLITDKNELSIPLQKEFYTDNDSVTVPEFEIEILLSPNAEKKIHKDKETIIVQAYLSGIPKDTMNEEYIEWGKCFLGKYKIELITDRVAKFENVKIPLEKFEELEDKNFEVLINVFTGRKSTRNNLLNSEILQNEIDNIKGQRHQLNAKLIEGDD